MPNLTDYSLADINKFSLLSDFPEDFKNACSSAELDLSIKFSDVNADGRSVSAEDFDLSERLLTATYMFQLTALMANRTITANAPGNFGLYGYLEKMASHFDKGERINEMANVALFVKCIQNALEFMSKNLPAFAEKNDLDETVSAYVSSKIADAKEYYDHADKVFSEFISKLPQKDEKEESKAELKRSLNDFYSLSLYDTSRLVYNEQYDYVNPLFSSAYPPAHDDKQDSVYILEKWLILSNLTYDHTVALDLQKHLDAGGAFDANDNVIKYVGMTGHKYAELKGASERNFRDLTQIKAYIVETDNLIAAIGYIISALKYINAHYVDLHYYKNNQQKLGYISNRYINDLFRYYNKLYADFIDVYNCLVSQYLSDMAPDADSVYFKYKSIIGPEAAKVKAERFKKENAKKSAPVKKDTAPAKQKTTTVSPAKPKTPSEPARTAADEKKMRDLSASAAYKMADDASVTDKQRNDYIENLCSYASATNHADTAIDLSEKALLIGRKSHYNCNWSIINLVVHLKNKNCITKEHHASGSFAGTLGSALAQCKKASTELPVIGNSFKMILALISLALCVGFIGYIWLVDPESVMWLGTGNMKKLFIVAGLGIISGMLSGGLAYVIINLVATGVIFTVGAIVTSVLDFSSLAQDRTILTIASLYFGYFACVFIYSNSPSVIKADKAKRTKMINELNSDIKANITYANAMIEALESMKPESANAPVLIEYYTALRKAFESIKL